jgi:N-glycosylase/DNA lyase
VATGHLTLPLAGPAGEPVDFRRTINGHGVTTLWPLQVDPAGDAITATIALPKRRARTVTVRESPPGALQIEVVGPRVEKVESEAIRAAIAHILRLDADLSSFYAQLAGDPDLAWAAAGAGRMTRCQTVFEDVVKTICTTNCAWSATERMVAALVEQLGEPAHGAPESGPAGRAFPTPAAMAARDETWYREVIRAGYRGRYLKAIAESVASGELDLEALSRATPEEIPDAELEQQLLALPGVGPYAAAHIMMMLGRCCRLVFDSWTRPTYARCVGATEPVPDAEMEARFAPYGSQAGAAFWLFLTRDWVQEPTAG